MEILHVRLNGPASQKRSAQWVEKQLRYKKNCQVTIYSGPSVTGEGDN